MRVKPGIGYVDDGEGFMRPEQTVGDGMSEALDTPGGLLLDEIRQLPHDRQAARMDEALRIASLEALRSIAEIPPILLQAANLRISAYGLLFAVNAAAINGISMEQAGIECAKRDGAVKHIDDLSHRHHKIASFLEQEERDKWLEIARRENLTAAEFEASLKDGKVVRISGVTRAAISKSKREWQRKFGIEQSRAGKSQLAIQAYRKRAFEVHHNTKT